MLGDFTRGARHALHGFTLVRQPGIRAWAVVPLLINVLLFGAGIWFGAAAFQDLMGWLLPTWLDHWIVRALLWLLFGVAVAFIAFYAFTLIANLIAAPFNGFLADRVERHLRGARGAEGIQRGVAAEAIGSIGAELRKLVYLAAWTLPLLLLFLIPVVNLLATPLWLAFGIWMLTLEYADCPLGNHGVTFPQGRRLMAERRGLALGFGSVILVLTLIPGLNLLAMPVGVCGATQMYVSELSDRVGHDSEQGEKAIRKS